MYTPMTDLAAWYRSALKTRPPGPDTTAHTLLLAEYDRATDRATWPDATRTDTVVMVQWCRVVITLAEAAHHAGHPAWDDAWDDAWNQVYDYYLAERNQVGDAQPRKSVV
ncbi:hypothetical protein ACIOZL_19585 [Streptomyces sp. NPDC087769]|uniref:hypothetical protein n=1 Tax=Streptomyces sp. NPDC087769 TaxID=3365802 RepID=UPI0037F215D3